MGITLPSFFKKKQEKNVCDSLCFDSKIQSLIETYLQSLRVNNRKGLSMSPWVIPLSREKD